MKKTLLTMLLLACVSLPAYAVEAPMPPEEEAPAMPMGKGMGGGMHDRMGGRHQQMMERMDADKDGSITKAEFNTFHEKHFEKMDQNKDGSITKEEMKGPRPPCPFMDKANGKTPESKK